VERGLILENPFKEAVAAISVGVFDGEVKLDLCYEEDSSADVDMNIVMTESGKFIEIQGTAEEKSFDFEQLTQMVNFAEKGILQIFNQLNG
jgi:ribonuclease PH